MKKLNILNLFDDLSIISAAIEIDAIDELEPVTSKYHHTNYLKFVVKQAKTRVSITYQFSGDEIQLDDVSISTGFLPSGVKDNTPKSDRKRTLADVQLQDVFINIADNEPYIQTWFDWLKKHQSVIDVNYIDLNQTTYYENIFNEGVLR